MKSKSENVFFMFSLVGLFDKAAKRIGLLEIYNELLLIRNRIIYYFIINYLLFMSFSRKEGVNLKLKSVNNRFNIFWVYSNPVVVHMEPASRI